MTRVRWKRGCPLELSTDRFVFLPGDPSAPRKLPRRIATSRPVCIASLFVIWLACRTIHYIARFARK